MLRRGVENEEKEDDEEELSLQFDLLTFVNG